MRVVVIGGSGNFGARICRALGADNVITVLSANRTAKIAAVHENVQSVQLDISDPTFGESLRALSPGLVIHCVGPFQGQNYHVAHAALRAGAHYLDLADGRGFVAGFREANNALALAIGRLAITGASTLPALSSAVIDSLATRFQRLESIELVIAPGQRAVRGAATLQAVFSYLGRPFKWLHDGEWIQVCGWQELKPYQLDCGARWSAACDVPDLELLPERYPTVRTVEFRAALEFRLQHVTLWLLAELRRRGVAVPMDRWARPLDRIAGILDRFGGPFGGMLVSAAGLDLNGARRQIRWQLVAPALDGPEIPCMAAILLARRLARSQLAGSGAQPCMGLLTIGDFEAEFARWSITSRVEEVAL